MDDTARAQQIATYRTQADECRQAARIAILPNLKSQYEEAAGAWEEMARGLERISTGSFHKFA